MKAKVTKIILLAIVTGLMFGGCASKETKDEALKVESEKRTQLMTIQTAQMQNTGKVLAAIIAKDDCSFSMTSQDGKPIENLSGIAFSCNNGGDTAAIMKEMNAAQVELAKAAAYRPKTAGVAWAESAGIFFDKGFGWAITATPWLATYGITKQISKDYSDITKHNSDAWGKAVGNVAENGGSTSVTEIRETTTTLDTSTVNNTSESIIDSSVVATTDVSNISVTDTFVDTSEIVNNTTTTTDTTNNTSVTEVFTDTFGSGNDFRNSNWDSFNTENYDLTEPYVPEPPAPPAP